MVAKVKVLWRRLSAPTRDAVSNAALSWVVLFGGAVAGWLGQVAQWASSSGRDPLPGLSSLGFAFLSGAAAAGIGVVTYVVQWARARRTAES